MSLTTFGIRPVSTFQQDGGDTPLRIKAASGASYTLTADQGEYSLTGFATTLRAERRLALAHGAYALTGFATALRAARWMALAQGTYTLTGFTVDMTKGVSLPMAVGAYALTGFASNLRRDARLVAASGSYNLTGHAAGLSAARRATAAAGLYALTGFDVDFVYVPVAADEAPRYGGRKRLTGAEEQEEHRLVQEKWEAIERLQRKPDPAPEAPAATPAPVVAAAPKEPRPVLMRVPRASPEAKTLISEPLTRHQMLALVLALDELDD